MRDILISLIVFGSLPLTLKRPYIGVLMWVWISVMNPHRLSYGFAYSFPFAAIIAATTLAALLIAKGPKKLPLTPVTLALIAFTLWMNVTTLFAFFPETSREMLSRVDKIMFMTLVTAMLIRTRRQLDLLIWVLVISLGYYGVKGGLFTILTGGGGIVWGPSGSFIEGNNEMALALITIIPMMYYLLLVSTNKWVKRGLGISMALCGFAAIGSYSRGALLGLSAMLLFLWLKSPKKAVPAMIMIMLIPIVLAVMPDRWSQRMDTIDNYQADASAMGRINAWKMATNLAKDRPLVGGGFDIWTGSIFTVYAPDPDDVHAAHSIYFQALGEHGFIGLGLYLLTALFTWRKGSWIRRRAALLPDYKWAVHLATMIQVSMLGFAVGGAFLSLLYYDVPYYLMMAMVVTGEVVAKALAEQSAARRMPVAALSSNESSVPVLI